MDYVNEEITYEKKRSSKQKLHTADLRKVKLYKHLGDSINNEDWSLAERYLGKINDSKKEKYRHLPGVNASEQTRLIGQLEFIVDSKEKTAVVFFLDEEGNLKYNI
jgi:hypothetical protein